MSIRSIILALACSLLAGQAVAAEKPYRVSLVGDSYDGKAWHTGIRIEMDEGWKTYWRMPGDSGVPPDFKWTTSVPAQVEVSYPVPERFNDQSGETIGYKHEVVLPVTVEAGDASEVKLGLEMFFGVCKEICIPVDATAEIELGAMMTDPLGSARVEAARLAVPPAGDGVKSMRLIEEGGKPALLLSFRERVDDVFVESETSAYFGAPRFSADGLEAALPVSNVKDEKTLAGKLLRITLRSKNTGLEQTLALP